MGGLVRGLLTLAGTSGRSSVGAEEGSTPLIQLCRQNSQTAERQHRKVMKTVRKQVVEFWHAVYFLFFLFLPLAQLGRLQLLLVEGPLGVACIDLEAIMDGEGEGDEQRVIPRNTHTLNEHPFKTA